MITKKLEKVSNLFNKNFSKVDKKKLRKKIKKTEKKVLTKNKELWYTLSYPRQRIVSKSETGKANKVIWKIIREGKKDKTQVLFVRVRF